MTTLCFDSAFAAFRQGQINEREYLHHCLVHFAGERHPADKTYIQRRFATGGLDPVGEAIRNAALNTVYIPLQGTLLLETLFDHVAHNNLHGLDTTLRELRARKPTFRAIIQPLAVYAAAKSNADALRFCLEHGATLQDENLHLALSMAARDTAANMDIYEARFRDLPPQDKALHGMAMRAMYYGAVSVEEKRRPRCRM